MAKYREHFSFLQKKTMIKTFALLMIVSGISSCGAFLSSALTKRCMIRRETSEFLNAVLNGVRFSALPINVIADRFLKEHPKASKLCLLKQTENSFYEYDCLKFLEISERDFVNDFLSGFGKAKCREAQLEDIRLFIAQYDDMRKNADEKCKTQSVLYGRLGIIFAIAFAIILI